ncbi:MAG: RsmE family RNA methyltransferase [Treponema sp.]
MRQFIAEHEPDNAGILKLSGKAYAYLVKVRRIKEGAVFPVVLPESGCTAMEVIRIDYSRQELLLRKAAGQQPLCTTAFPYRLILMQWVLKGEKNDIVVRQATEAGVSLIVPVTGEFSVAKKQSSTQHERFKRIIREARQQSGSPISTEISEPHTLSHALDMLAVSVAHSGTFRAVCSEKTGETITLHEGLAQKPETIILAIGSEGGISTNEYRLLAEAHFQTVHFNTNILRAETAALYAVAAIQTIMNEVAQWQLSAPAY